MCELSDKLLDMADPRNMQPVSSYVMTLNQSADELDARAATIEALEKRLAELEGLLSFTYDTLQEINPSNYDHDDVCSLNAASVEVILAIAPAIRKPIP